MRILRWLRRKSIELAFYGLIAVGIGFLLYWPIHYQATACVSSQETPSGPKDNHAQPGSQRAPTAAAQQKVVANDQKKSANQGKREPYTHNPGWIDHAVCDSGVTDIGLVFFTYCLVVVGWATMKSGEKNTRDMERAYLFGGGYDVPGAAKQAFNAGGILSNGMMCTNSGRTYGILTEYYVGLGKSLPTGWRKYPKAGTFFTEEQDLVVSPNVPIILNPAIINLHETPIMWGYVKYRDMFLGRHISCWAIQVNPQTGRITSIGGNRWNGWD